MNFIIKKSFSFLSHNQKINNLAISEYQQIHVKPKPFDLILGVSSAVIAFPLVTIIILFSAFFTEDKWEEFWDKFLEV